MMQHPPLAPWGNPERVSPPGVVLETPIVAAGGNEQCCTCHAAALDTDQPGANEAVQETGGCVAEAFRRRDSGGRKKESPLRRRAFRTAGMRDYA